MRHHIRLVTTTLLFVFLAINSNASAQSEDEPLLLADPALAQVTSAYATERLTRTFVKTRLELRRLYASRDPRLSGLAGSWIALEKELTSDERISFWYIALECTPGSDGAYDANRSIKLSRLKASPRAERAEVYRVAIERGQVVLGEVVSMGGPVTLTREEACSLAAREGIEDVAQLIETHGGTVNGLTNPYTLASLLTTLRFRRGAKDEDAAIGLHLRRLKELSPDELRVRATSDIGFRYSTLSLKRELDRRRDETLLTTLAFALKPAFEICKQWRTDSCLDDTPVREGCEWLSMPDLRYRAQLAK